MNSTMAMSEGRIKAKNVLCGMRCLPYAASEWSAAAQCRHHLSRARGGGRRGPARGRAPSVQASASLEAGDLEVAAFTRSSVIGSLDVSQGLSRIFRAGHEFS